MTYTQAILFFGGGLVICTLLAKYFGKSGGDSSDAVDFESHDSHDSSSHDSSDHSGSDHGH